MEEDLLQPLKKLKFKLNLNEVYWREAIFNRDVHYYF